MLLSSPSPDGSKEISFSLREIKGTECTGSTLWESTWPYTIIAPLFMTVSGTETPRNSKSVTQLTFDDIFYYTVVRILSPEKFFA